MEETKKQIIDFICNVDEKIISNNEKLEIVLRFIKRLFS